jgi:hypothetical protein
MGSSVHAGLGSVPAGEGRWSKSKRQNGRRAEPRC